MKKICHWMIALILSVISNGLQSASIDISASFSPDFNNPDKDEFTNTTPVAGMCGRWPHLCEKYGITYSVLLPIITTRSYNLPANNKPRDGVYFKFPKENLVRVTNEYGETHELSFEFVAFNSTYRKPMNNGDYGWVRGDFYYGVPGCPTAGVSVATNVWYAFAWFYNGTPCVKQSRIERTGDDTVQFYDQSFVYKLKAPDPLSMGSGIYRGQLRWTVGPGADIDYGDNYKSDSSEVIVNFTLSVNHELKVTPASGSTDVTLFPCYHGTKCTAAEEDKNWERWMVTNIPPQSMTGSSKFNISSSGSFTVYMTCGSGSPSSADSCPMSSVKSGTVVPVKALITLPENIKSQRGGGVIFQPLYTEKDLSRNRFRTINFGTDRPGQVDFFIDKKAISEMLKSRPDSWSGSVTLIFDPNLY